MESFLLTSTEPSRQSLPLFKKNLIWLLISGGEDVSVAGQSLDYSGSSVTNDDTGSITSFNISASLLDSTKKTNKANSTEKLNDKKDKKRSEYKVWFFKT